LAVASHASPRGNINVVAGIVFPVTDVSKGCPCGRASRDGTRRSAGTARL